MANEKLSVNGISYRYSEKERYVLNNVSLKLNYGEHISVIGNSGCGKSTLIKLIQGTLKLKEGSIENNFNRISYVPQTHNLLPYLTIKQNLELHYKIVKKIKVQEDRLNFIFELVNLDNSLLNKYPRELSGGQRQRASIANALIIDDTDLLIFDESFSALDEINRFDIQDTLMSIIHKNQKLSILEITHNIDEALISSDKILHLGRGKVLFYGTPMQLYVEKDKIPVETRHFVWKDNFDCKINWDAWRISAIKKMEKLNKDSIAIVDDNDKIIKVLTKDIIEKSLYLNDKKSLKDL